MEANEIGKIIGTLIRIGIASYLGYLFIRWLINKYKKHKKKKLKPSKSSRKNS